MKLALGLLWWFISTHLTYAIVSVAVIAIVVTFATFWPVRQ